MSVQARITQIVFPSTKQGNGSLLFASRLPRRLLANAFGVASAKVGPPTFCRDSKTDPASDPPNGRLPPRGRREPGNAEKMAESNRHEKPQESAEFVSRQFELAFLKNLPG